MSAAATAAAAARSAAARAGSRDRPRRRAAGTPRRAPPAARARRSARGSRCLASTTVPGSVRIRSTRPSVDRGIQRMSSGTSVPGPRTWRSIEPRLTVSGHTDPSSTVGAAGFSCARPTVTSTSTSRPATAKMVRRMRFCRATEGRGMSMILLQARRMTCGARPYNGQTAVPAVHDRQPLGRKGLRMAFTRRSTGAPVAALGLRRPRSGQAGRCLASPRPAASGHASAGSAIGEPAHV